MYKENYKKIRFHVEFGPDSLFERVHFKMQNVKTLYIKGNHFQKRVEERDISKEIIDQLLQFDCTTWTLKTCSVREDRGKFVDSTWEKVVEGNAYWVTIGMGNYIKTIVIKETNGVEKCLRSGEYYDFVAKVNSELMEKEELL